MRGPILLYYGYVWVEMGGASQCRDSITAPVRHDSALCSSRMKETQYISEPSGQLETSLQASSDLSCRHGNTFIHLSRVCVELCGI